MKRTEINFLEKDVAEKWGISQSYLSQLLSGRRNLGWEKCKRIGPLLSVEPAQLKDAPPHMWRYYVYLTIFSEHPKKRLTKT